MVIRRLTRPTVRTRQAVDGMLLEYLGWCVERLTADCGLVFDDPDAVIAAHHESFHDELPKMLGPAGRLLVASLDGEPAGVGALKPVDATTAEIKRMYVRPWARGRAVGRALLDRLVRDATELGYRTARLETASFMTQAHALYRSIGFRDIPTFDHNEASMSGLEAHMRFMELPLSLVAPLGSGHARESTT